MIVWLIGVLLSVGGQAAGVQNADDEIFDFLVGHRATADLALIRDRALNVGRGDQALVEQDAQVAIEARCRVLRRFWPVSCRNRCAPWPLKLKWTAGPPRSSAPLAALER